MGERVVVAELPGIGTRYDVTTARRSQRLSVVVHKDGRREVYAFDRDRDEPSAVIELTDEQARVLGAVLAGTWFGG